MLRDVAQPRAIFEALDQAAPASNGVTVLDQARQCLEKALVEARYLIGGPFLERTKVDKQPDHG